MDFEARLLASTKGVWRRPERLLADRLLGRQRRGISFFDEDAVTPLFRRHEPGGDGACGARIIDARSAMSRVAA